MKEIFGKWWAGSLDDDLKTLRGKVEHLTALESDNLAAVKNAEIQPGKKRKREVELWFTNVKEKQSELKQIEVEIREQGYSTNLKSRIEKETKEVEELIQQGKFPKGVVLDDHASTRLPMVASRLVGQSCTENTESIMRLLKEEDVFGIGIYGMGGVGKTTLVKEIHNFLISDSDIKGQVYWVTASRDCSLEKLQNEIGKAVGLKEDISQEDNERRKALLFQRFVKLGKSVLIIDDLWKHYLPELIGIPLEPCGCKIVITTRSLDVCRKMGCQKNVKLEPLLKVDAMQLFVEKLGAIPSYLNKFAEEIVSECGGLPLALITMGCCMRGKDDVHDWENALYELRRRRHDDMEEEVFPVLGFSFDNLKDEKVQNCFLSCVLFPEDKEIKRDKLVDLWINEGLLDEVENRQGRVSRGHAILNRLTCLCLLESSGDDYVKMHDLLRDMAIIITQKHPLFFAKSGLQLERVPEEKLWSNDLVKVSLSCNKIKEIPFGMAPLTPHLTVLILNNNILLEKIPESFFEHMRALKVLDLSRTYIKRLPESVSKLENLRALLLVNCKLLTYVPSLEKLTKLEVLNFENCWELTYVPSVEKLTELRVLDCDTGFIMIDKNRRFIEAPKGIESLKCLEKVTNVRWDKSDITGFNKLIQSSPSLNCYRFWLQLSIGFSPNYAFRLSYRMDYDYNKAVFLIGLGLEDKETSYLLPTTIKMLGLIKCDMVGRRLGDVFPTLARATDLHELLIQHCRGLINLEHLCLPNLRRLKISRCRGLKVVLPFAQHLCLPNLKSLDCDELEEIFESNKGTRPNPILSHHKLKYLADDIAWQRLERDYPQDADDIRHHINRVSDDDSGKAVIQISDDDSDEMDDPNPTSSYCTLYFQL